MSESTLATRSSPDLPLPVTTNGDVTLSSGWIGVGRSAAPSLIALAAGLTAVFHNRPKAELLFIGAGTVALGLYFVFPPKDDGKTHHVPLTFLRRAPDIFTASACILIVLGIGNAFPDKTALIPLFSFVSFSALAALFGTVLGVWTTATLYATALVSLTTFVVLTFMA